MEGCGHEQLRCTDNRYFCLICGQEIQMPIEEPKAESKAEEKAVPEKSVKKTSRKKA